MTRLVALMLGFSIAAALGAPVAEAGPANYAGASADGGKVFFTTTQKLVPGDTDNRLDVYARYFDSTLKTYVTRELSTGPTGGNDAYPAQYDGASVNGSKVFFSTAESLVSEDTDRSTDVYMRDLTTGETKLVSQGSASCLAFGCGNGSSDATYVGASVDGSKVFFISAEKLTPAAVEGRSHLYERDLTAGTTGETVLVSQGNGPAPVVFRGASADGSKVVFTTTEQLAPGAVEGRSNIYMRDLTMGETKLVSVPGIFCPPKVNCTPIYGGMSSDGAHVFFETSEQLSPEDTDNSQDIYAWSWSTGTATLASTGSGGGNGIPNATFDGATPDGSKVFFSTKESLIPGATENHSNVYMRDLTAGTTGETVLVSQGSASCAGCGNGTADATFDGATPDGSKVFFSTKESLTPGEPAENTDGSTDVYMRDLTAGTTTLMSPEGVCPLPGETGCDATFDGASEDGKRVFFSTLERLSKEDIDSEPDIYERAEEGGKWTTRLVSAGNSAPLGPATPVLSGTNPVSPNSSTTPAIVGKAEPGTSIKIYETPDCSGAPIATEKTAGQLGEGISIPVTEGKTTSVAATATNIIGDTSGCSNVISYTQVAGAGGGGGGGGNGGEPPKSPKPPPLGLPPRGGPHHVTPQALITFAPGFKTRMRRPEFRFVDATGQEGTSFACKVDRHGWHGCSSPQRLKRLRAGRHAFQVKGVNSGIWETSPVVRKFKVIGR
jgi:Tol biopolymer transport system component